MENDYSIAIRLLLHLCLIVEASICTYTFASRIVVETTPTRDNIMIVSNLSNIISCVLTGIFIVVEIQFVCLYFVEEFSYNYEIFAIIMQLYYMVLLRKTLIKQEKIDETRN